MSAEAHVTGRRVVSRFQQFPGYGLVQVQSAPLGCCTVSPQRIAALSGSLLKAPGSAGGYLPQRGMRTYVAGGIRPNIANLYRTGKSDSSFERLRCASIEEVRRRPPPFVAHPLTSREMHMNM